MIFTYSIAESGILFTLKARDEAKAIEIKDKVQSVCGSFIERDEDFLYVLVDADEVDEATKEIEDAGYDVEEG